MSTVAAAESKALVRARAGTDTCGDATIPVARGGIDMPDESTAIETQSTELLRTLIRNGCVNTGEAASGHEDRSVAALEDFFAGSGLSCERYTSEPGRMSLITRIEGSDPKAPTLLLMGHTDVVPVNMSGWQRDPFAAELVDGIARLGGAVGSRHHRGLAATHDVKPPLELRAAAGADDLHLGDALRADLRPQRRREAEPLVLQVGGERIGVQQVKDAGDVEVAGLGLERATRQVTVADRLGQRQPEQIATRWGNADLG